MPSIRTVRQTSLRGEFVQLVGDGQCPGWHAGETLNESGATEESCAAEFKQRQCQGTDRQTSETQCMEHGVRLGGTPCYYRKLPEPLQKCDPEPCSWRLSVPNKTVARAQGDKEQGRVQAHQLTVVQH